MTEQEIIDYLGKTSLPTLLVEGEDDAAVYRWLEAQLGVFSGSVLFCSGRDVLISIYRRRDTFPHGKIAWLADLDMWRFSVPPADLAGIVFTTGYSIENDLYAGAGVESLLEAAERNQHTQLLTVLCRWFAFEILEFQAGRPAEVATHIKRIVDFAAMDLSPDFRARRGYSEPDATLVNQVLSDYKLQLRGKTLLQALIQFLSDARRNPKYGYAAIVELCLKLYPANPFIQRLMTEVKNKLS
jgi:hypothetical protein